MFRPDKDLTISCTGCGENIYYDDDAIDMDGGQVFCSEECFEEWDAERLRKYDNNREEHSDDIKIKEQAERIKELEATVTRLKSGGLNE